MIGKHIDINDTLSRFKNGEIPLEQFRKDIADSIRTFDITLDQVYGGNLKGFEKMPQEVQNNHVAAAIEFGEFLKSVYQAKSGNPEAHKRLDTWNTKSTLVEGTPNLGGYLVPDEFSNTLVKFMAEESVTIPRMRNIKMKTDKMYIPGEDSKVSVEFHSEGDEATETNPTFEQNELSTYRMDGYVITSNELLEDSSLETTNILLSQFTGAMAELVDSSVFNGDGSDTYAGFSGVFSAKTGYSSVLSAGSDAFSSVLVSDLIDLYHDVPSYARNTGTFVMHPNVLKFLKLEQDSNGDYRWPPYNAIGVPKIHQYEVIESTQCPSTSGADTAFVSFGNYRYLAYGLRKNFSLIMDPYTLSTKYQSILVFVQRMALAWLKTAAFTRLLTAS